MRCHPSVGQPPGLSASTACRASGPAAAQTRSARTRVLALTCVLCQNKEMMKGMMSMEDVVHTSTSVVSIDSVKLFAGGLAAVATYTAHEQFSFKGCCACLCPLQSIVSP